MTAPKTFIVDLDAAKTAPSPARKGRPSRFTPAVRRERHLEQSLRNQLTSQRIVQLLRLASPDLYASLHDIARGEIDAKRGPLPGDEPVQ